MLRKCDNKCSIKHMMHMYYLVKPWAVCDWQAQCVKALSQYHVIWSVWTVTATATGEDFQHCHSTKHHTDKTPKRNLDSRLHLSSFFDLLSNINFKLVVNTRFQYMLKDNILRQHLFRHITYVTKRYQLVDVESNPTHVTWTNVYGYFQSETMWKWLSLFFLTRQLLQKQWVPPSNMVSIKSPKCPS